MITKEAIPPTTEQEFDDGVDFEEDGPLRKNTRPDNYKPPKTIEDLLGRVKRGERFFCDALIHGGHCEWKDFAGSNFTGAVLKGVVFHDADFSGTAFLGANLRGCYFLGDSKFSDCDFSGAVLSSAEVAGRSAPVRFTRCNFEKADLHHTRGFEFDDCYIAGARLPKKLSDTWTRLRTEYTGIRAAVNLLLLIVFFLPYLVETIVLVSVSRLETSSQVHGSLCAQGCAEVSIGMLLIGYHNGWASVLPAILLIVYNIMRAYLTVKVAPLREIEERCDYTPSYADYRHLEIMRMLVRLVAVFAVLSFINHLYLWLTSLVSVPIWLLR